MKKDVELIKQAIEHIDEVLESNCNEACKQDHANLKRWLEELLECRGRVCKNCKYGEYRPTGFICTNEKEVMTVYMCFVDENFGCNRFERRRK